jgi:hypothetical protein
MTNAALGAKVISPVPSMVMYPLASIGFGRIVKSSVVAPGVDNE